MLNKSIAAAVAVVCLGVAGAATAGAHMTDAQYVAAARCQALASASSLGVSDSHAFDALVREQERGRTEIAYEAAQDAREKAARQARAAGPYEKSQLAAERDGPCRAMVTSTTAPSGAGL
jgi:hypothetical protein